MTPIKRILTFAATGTAQTATVYVSESGFAPVVAVDASDLSGTKSVSIAVTDPDGYDVFGSGACTGGGITYFGRIGSVSAGTVPLYKSYTIVGTLSEAWGGTGGTITVVFYADCRRDE